MQSYVNGRRTPGRLDAAWPLRLAAHVLTSPPSGLPRTGQLLYGGEALAKRLRKHLRKGHPEVALPFSGSDTHAQVRELIIAVAIARALDVSVPRWERYRIGEHLVQFV
jgi:hypothetical protein